MYRALNNRNPEQCLLAFFDLTSDHDLHPILGKRGVTPSAPFQRLHIATEDGQILTSMNAFCEVWCRLPYWKYVVPVLHSVPGLLTLSDFLYATIADIRLKYWPSKVEVFKEFDVDHDGLLCREELKLLLQKNRKVNVMDQDIDSILKIADSDRDGYLNYTDFVKHFYSGTRDDSRPAKRPNAVIGVATSLEKP